MGREGMQAACLQGCLNAGSTFKGVTIVGLEGQEAAYSQGCFWEGGILTNPKNYPS